MSQLKPGDKFRFASWHEGGVFVYDYYRFEASYYAGQIRRERRYYYHRDGVKIKDKFGRMVNLTESGCMNWQVYKVG